MMSPRLKGPRPRHSEIRLLVLCALTGCTAWRTQTSPTPETIRGRKYEMVRIVRRSGQTDSLFAASVISDSVIGSRRDHNGAGRTAIAIADVARMDWRTTEKGKTAALVAGVAAGLLVLVGIPAAISATP